MKKCFNFSVFIDGSFACVTVFPNGCLLGRVEETVNQKNKVDENLRKREKEVHELKNRCVRIRLT